MDINYTLKFSWGHIIAFIALIFISYVSFMGITYLSGGNFIAAGVGVFAIDLIIILFFLLPQILKGTEKKFHKMVIFERILICFAPFVFVVVMVPYYHFWSVFENREKIEQTFSEAIISTKKTFVAYEKYADNRINIYEKKLSKKKIEPYQRKNKVEALRLQICDQNFRNLKSDAFNWIDDAQGATVWNVFMLGNIDKIENAIDEWNKALTTFSKKKMAEEDIKINAFSSSDSSVQKAKADLKNLQCLYKEFDTITLTAIISTILLYFLLMFPYILQRRNTKSTYRLFGQEAKGKIRMTYDDTNELNENGTKQDVKTSEKQRSAKKVTKEDITDDYGTFEM